MKPTKARFGTDETSYEQHGIKWPKYSLHAIIIILAMLLISSLHECRRRGNLADANLDALTDTITHFKNRLGTVTASKTTLQLSNKQLQDYVIAKDKELAELSKEFVRLNHVVKAEAELKIDSIPVPYAVPVPCDFERSGTINDNWYSFGYSSNQNGFKIDSLKVPVSVVAITGAKRKWFFGAETITTDVTFNNPHITVSNIQAAELTLHTPWYKKWYIWAIAGFAGGMVLGK